MDTLSYKTLSANKETANKQWFIVDAEGQVLGRMASKVAKVLRGKYKTNFTPHADCGDYVIVVNAAKIIMTGKKMKEREIFTYTGYPGGQKRVSPSSMMDKDGTSVVRHAIKGMLPKNKLGAKLFRNLYVYNDSKHSQDSQKPVSINLNNIN